MKLGANTIRSMGLGAVAIIGGFLGYSSLNTSPDRPSPPVFIDAGQYASEMPAETAAYAPLLGGEVFDVTDYGADITGKLDSTLDIREAIAAAKAWTLANANAPVTVYFPEGDYRVAPTGPWASPGYCFNIDFSNVTLEGDGANKTRFFFRSKGNADPSGAILLRGGLFSRVGGSSNVANIKWRGFRASGGASVDTFAGQPSYGSSPNGWDVTHKGIALSSEFQTTGIVIEFCEFDNWRGECIWSGGGTELGSQTITDCVIRQCNASAISNGGGVTVDNCHIYDVYNGTECFALGDSVPLGVPQFLEVRNSVIEVNRNLTGDLKIGKFGVVYLGYPQCHLVAEDNTIGDTNQGGVFLAESASNVTIQRNTFEDTIGVYCYSPGGYPSLPPEELNVYDNWLVTDNTFTAATRNVDSAINSVQGGSDWTFTDNTTVSTGAFTVGIFLVSPGATGTFLVSGNVIADSRPIQANTGTRPTFTLNTITGQWSDGETFFSYDPTAADPFEVCPAWGKVAIVDSAAPSHPFTLTFPERFPEGFGFTLARIGTGSGFFGVEVIPDASWNTLTRGYMLFAGGVLNMTKNASGDFDFVSFTPNTVNVRTLTQTATTGQTAASEIAVFGQLEVNLSPTVAQTYSSFTGVAIGETIDLNLNANVTLDHVPGVLEMSNGVDYVSAGTVTLSATRVGDALEVTIP
jgi:hypothetical protein